MIYSENNIIRHKETETWEKEVGLREERRKGITYKQIHTHEQEWQNTTPWTQCGFAPFNWANSILSLKKWSIHAEID